MELARLIRNCHRAVVFTGAGISTESGIPDFRSPGGVWSKMKPIMFDDFCASEEAQRETWRRRFEGSDGWVGAKPNAGHMAVSGLVQIGTVSHVITQNVDNLHQHSGIEEARVIELHGNASYASCLSCHTRYELDYIKSQWRQMGTAAPCENCGGLVKPATISFGQPMPETQMERAQSATLACDLFVAIGSSLQVFPAAGFPIVAKKNGAKLVILNREPTDLDSIADLVINEEIGPTLKAVMAELDVPIPNLDG